MTTVRIELPGQRSTRSLRELLPPLSEDDRRRFAEEMAAIDAAEKEGWRLASTIMIGVA